MSTVLLVVNPAAGRTDKRPAVALANSYLCEQGINFQTFWTQPDSYESGQLRAVLAQGFDTVFVFGGDGTINQVINSLPPIAPALALFPMGSGNDFARNFSIANNLKDQLHAGLHAPLQQLDLFTCNGRLFANGVGIGFDGYVAKQMLRRKRRGETAYHKIVISSLLRYRCKSIEASASDGWQYRGLSFMITVANGRYFGGFCLTPKASLTDGRLDVSLVKKTPVYRRLGLIGAFKKGSQINLSLVEYSQHSDLSIKAGAGVFAHIDGEFGGEGSFEFKKTHLKLLVRAYPAGRVS